MVFSDFFKIYPEVRSSHIKTPGNNLYFKG